MEEGRQEVGGGLQSAFGANMRAQRRKRGLDMKGFARLIGVSPPIVKAFETDNANPRLSTLENVARRLGVSVPRLLQARRRG